MNSDLDSPMVYLAPEKHAFIVLGNGSEAVITWSRSYRLACEQADIHFGTVVAVPIVHDMSWRQPSQEGPATQVAVPTASLEHLRQPLTEFERRAGVVDPVDDGDEGPAVTGWADIAAIAGGGPAIAPGTSGPLGRAARATARAESAAGWGGARPDVVGQVVGREYGPLVQRVAPFGDPAAPELPADREGALKAAFGGSGEAVAAFHAPSQADVGTLEVVRDGLAGLR